MRALCAELARRKLSLPQGIVAVAAGRTAIAGDVSPLRVIEHVEGFGAELKTHLLPDFEVLEQGPVEVEAIGIVQDVASSVAEGQSPWQGKGSGIAECRPEVGDRPARNAGPRIAHQIGSSARSHSIGNARVVVRHDYAVGRSG